MLLNRTFSKISKVSSLSILVSTLAISCGGSPQSVTPPVTTPVYTPANTPTPPPVVTNPVTTTLPATASTTLNGAYTYSFQLQNSTISCNNSGVPTPAGVQVGTFTTSEISTDNIFKITVSAGAPTTIPCTGYTGNYSCVQYTVTVGSRSQNVTVSYGNPLAGPCAGIPSSKTLDFSDQATVGHGPLTVKVSQPLSDNCHSNTYGFAMYGAKVVEFDQCSMAPVYSNQIVSGNLAVITNQ